MKSAPTAIDAIHSRRTAIVGGLSAAAAAVAASLPVAAAAAAPAARAGATQDSGFVTVKVVTPVSHDWLNSASATPGPAFALVMLQERTPPRITALRGRFAVSGFGIIPPCHEFL